MAGQSRRLEGIRVVDMTMIMAGPSGTMFLGDLGAGVVKGENPVGGDVARTQQPYLFEVVNRNKRSIAVDFTTESGRDVLERLIGTADVLVQSFRPGALAAHGFGPQDVMPRYPRLIYASLSAFGERGPGTGRRGVDAAVRMQMFDHAEFGATGRAPNSAASIQTMMPTSGHYDVKDGRVYLAANQAKEWPMLCDLIGQPELTEDPRFATRALRSQNAEALREILSRYFLSATLDEVTSQASARNMMISPILDYPAVVSHPQVAANDSLRKVTSAAGESITQVRAPARLRSEAEGVYRPAPALGADTASLARELGYPDKQIDQMVDDRALRAF